MSPPEIVREVLHSTELAFVREHATTLFVAIRLEGDLVNLISGLKATSAHAQRIFVKPIGSLGFHTDLAAGLGGPVVPGTPEPSSSSGDVEKALLECFVEHPHYLLTLQKRPDVDAAYMERISVGRAPNRDIVLRHGSVSKFHAWFESDENGVFRLTDSGSKNGTRLNGQPLMPREAQEVRAGDAVTFGFVRTTICDARTLWRVLWKG